MIQKLLLIVLFFCMVSCDFSSATKEVQTVSLLQESKESDVEMVKEIPYNLLERMKARDEISSIVSQLDTLEIAHSLQFDQNERTFFIPSNTVFDSYAGLVGVNELIDNHTVSNKITTIYLTKNIRSHGGSYSFTTVSGKTLVAYKVGADIYLKDILGNIAKVGKSDISATNGLIHIIEGVLYP